MTIRSALELVIADYKVKGYRSVTDLKCRIYKSLLHHLDGDQDMSTLSLANLTVYAGNRLDEGVTTATVNREVAILRRAASLAETRFPRWKKLRESEPRQGFFKGDEYRRIMAHLPSDLFPVVELYWLTGWRRSEVAELRWSEVDFERNEIRLPPERAKNGEARVCPISPRIRAILEALPRRGEQVFYRRRSKKPLKTFYPAWRKACCEAGLPGKLLHDFRRTFARRIAKKGVDRKTGMMLLGHKTENMFVRYHIVDNDDLHEAAAVLAKAVEDEEE